MKSKCTIKDIAATLHLSRNTVAKVLNGVEGVSEGTRKLVLEKANEMNYRQNTHALAQHRQHAPKSGSILFLSRASFKNSDFWIKVLYGINTILHDSNYDLVMYILTPDELECSKFPPSLSEHTVDGVILVDIYDPDVCQKITDFNVPTVFLEMPYKIDSFIGKADFVTMENMSNIKRIVAELIGQGVTDIAFAGDITSKSAGAGFHERWEAVRSTLRESNLDINERCCFLSEPDEEISDLSKIKAKLIHMGSLPKAYICGNDWVALHLMKAVQSLGYRIPEDILFVGFDDIEEAGKSTPTLTTIRTPKEYLGRVAAKKLLARINNPTIPYEISHFSTKIIVRQSTGKLLKPTDLC